MREQALAELDVDSIRGVRQRIGAQVLERNIEHPMATRPPTSTNKVS